MAEWVDADPRPPAIAPGEVLPKHIGCSLSFEKLASVRILTMATVDEAKRPPAIGPQQQFVYVGQLTTCETSGRDE